MPVSGKRVAKEKDYEKAKAGDRPGRSVAPHGKRRFGSLTPRPTLGKLTLADESEQFAERGGANDERR